MYVRNVHKLQELRATKLDATKTMLNVNLFAQVHSFIPTFIPTLLHLPLLSKESLFAFSLFPYLGFLWFLTRSQQTPKLALVGFYMTLVFVAVTIPAGIYAEVVYGQSLANVDFLHGAAELFLTLANVLVVVGFRQAVLAKR